MQTKPLSLIMFILVLLTSCTTNQLVWDEPTAYTPHDYEEISDIITLQEIILERDEYIESLYGRIETLTIAIDSLRSEIDFTSSRIFINEGFEIPLSYSFAGVEIDLSNDRIRSMLHDVYNNEVRRAHQFIPRSGIYWDLFDEILQQHGIHPDIKYIAVIESNLNYMAYSQARAAGLWQFIPSTARLFNLNINSYLDERRNVFKSTDAACRYLIQAHAQLNAIDVDDWLITLCSYNGGVGGISRTIREQQAKDFSSLIMRIQETNSYIWRAIATKMIFEFEDVIFDEPFERMPPLLETNKLVAIQVNGYHDLAEWAIAMGSSTRQLWELNPWINMSRTRTGRYSEVNHLIIPPGSYEILVPINSVADPAKLTEAERKLAIRNNAPFISGNAVQHRVQRGETLSTIARRYNVSVNDLRRWNNIRGDMIYAGQVLNLQSSSSGRTTTTSTTSEGRKYTVQSGDTIGSIARKLGVSQNTLMTRNNLSPVLRNGREVVIIRPGQVLDY